MTRTFIAVPVPDALTLRLTRLQGQLAGSVEGVRWAVAMPFHITLAFLGDVDHADLVAVCRAVADEIAAFPPMAIRLDGIGAFPEATRPRVIWAGVSGPGIEQFGSLQQAVARGVKQVNYPTDQKAFHPHVTIGRAGNEGGRSRKPSPVADITRLVNHYKTWHAGPFEVKEVIAFGSTVTRDGPTYTPLGRAPLKGAKSPKLPT